MTAHGAIAAGPPAHLGSIVVEACTAVGLPTHHIRLLRHFSNAVFLVEDASIVARVAYGPGNAERARRGIRVARWLSDQKFPVTAPAPLPLQELRPTGESVSISVSFWHYYRQPGQEQPIDLSRLGELTRSLHQLPHPPLELPRYQPLQSIASAIETASDVSGCDTPGLRWLHTRVQKLMDEYNDLEFPLGTGLIHGDMYAGNALWSSPSHADASDIVLGDWDSVCIGPREIDLAPTFTAARFGLEQRSIDRFFAGYGHDIRGWPGLATLREMRELSTLTALVRLAPVREDSARELRHRLDTLRDGDDHALWARQ